MKVRTLATISDYTRLCGLPPPSHPLLTLIDLEKTRKEVPPEALTPYRQEFYSIWVKKNLKGKIHYGHQSYDFNEGVMGFMGPGQVFAIDPSLDISALSGWMLLVHPDLLVRYPLGKKIAGYGFFAYEVHEALHLSAAEELTLDGLLAGIRAEYERPIDAFSQEVLVAQLDVLLTYANRFYHRQFLTRRAPEHDLLTRFETALATYFAPDAPNQPLPTVQHFADQLHVSPAYLSDMLRTLTGQTTQQHLHYRLIEKAKSLLLTTSLSVNETAFQLGFEYPQYFTRLFKSKTGLTPAAFRASAN
jgi:AraC family transcriptional regulator, transcriptional activator of pobA